MNDKIARMKELIDLLNKASMLYYQKSTPMMTDYEYDKLYDELVSLEKESNMVFSNSPTINVEPTVSTELEKTTHPYPLLSLSKPKIQMTLFLLSETKKVYFHGNLMDLLLF